MHSRREQIIKWADESAHVNEENINQIIQAAEAEPTHADWVHFLKTALLTSAVISICSGVIFFFAYNWQDISRFTKFAVVEAAMLIATFSYIRIATTKLLSSCALLAMSLLTGALLALVGQTYQTGADPWQLFASWAFLILPWTIIARANSAWVLWVVLVNLSVMLYMEISHGIFGILFSEEITLWIFSLLNTSLLCVFEYFSQRNKTTNNKRYINQLLALVAGIATTFLAIWSIFEFKVGIAGFVFYTAWIACVFYIYRYQLRDLFILSMTALSGIVVTISCLIRVIDNALDNGGFLLISLAIIGLSSLAGIWLKSVSQQFAKESGVDEMENTCVPVSEATK